MENADTVFQSKRQKIVTNNTIKITVLIIYQMKTTRKKSSLMEVVVLQLLWKSLSSVKPVSVLQRSQGPKSTSKPESLKYVPVTFLDMNCNVILKFRPMDNNLAFQISQITDTARKSSLVCKYNKC